MRDLILAIAFSACLYALGLITGIYGFTSLNYTRGYEDGRREMIERLYRKVQEEIKSKQDELKSKLQESIVIEGEVPEA